MYIIVMIVCGLVVAKAAQDRLMPPILWGFWSFLVPVIGIPLYLAHRNLKAGESRRGGRWWNVMRYGAVVWSAFCLAWAGRSILGVGGATPAAAVGAAIVVFGAWLIPTAITLVIGVLLKTDEVEVGPTGALADAGDFDGPEMAGGR